RDPAAASNLVAAVGRKGLSVAVVTRYRRRDRFDMQQDVIATTLPVASAGWSGWRNAKELTPPRGYAFASVVVSPAVTANVYAVHLKSNYGANTAFKRDMNRDKRTKAVEQLMEIERRKRGQKNPPVIIAGDLNADCWRKEFAEEKIFTMMVSAGFVNSLALLPEHARGTHPSKKWGDSALDYIMTRDFEILSAPTIIPNDELSDHYALFAVLDAGR
ncbi:MAG: endonuclease/exonuclease/phosphatase family protein, partial [Kiritimatiellae bacterium]|nr:endonuclease/exonuclease/phosphatase family protein [Kiritimatiellia bacterium]